MTRPTILFIAALLGSLTSASAENLLSLANVQPRSDTLKLGMVQADGDGFVIVHELRGEETGALLGSEAIHAGSNPDVTVSLRSFSRDAALVLLVVNGEAVASQRIRFDSD